VSCPAAHALCSQAPLESSVMADANEQHTEPLRPVLGCVGSASGYCFLGWDAWAVTVDAKCKPGRVYSGFCRRTNKHKSNQNHAYRLTFCSGEPVEEHRSGAETILGTQEGAERNPTITPKPFTCGRSTVQFLNTSIFEHKYPGKFNFCQDIRKCFLSIGRLS
jgi:hypothetical protein